MRSSLAVALAVLGFVVPGAALAGANKTWVSGTGKDAGTCLITAPCASFQYAVNQTAAGGEVDVKDAGGYGVVTITKPISIVAAPGILATISVPAGGTGVTVDTGEGNIVILEGITIDGHLLGGTGIISKTAAVLINLQIRNLSDGIDNSASLSISNSDFTGNSFALKNTITNLPVYLTNNRFIYNSYGVLTNNGDVVSYGDNVFTGFGTAVVGSFDPMSKQ